MLPGISKAHRPLLAYYRSLQLPMIHFRSILAERPPLGLASYGSQPRMTQYRCRSVLRIMAQIVRRFWRAMEHMGTAPAGASPPTHSVKLTLSAVYPLP